MRIDDDVGERLRLIETTRRDQSEIWPEGCYGSARAWLLFVGPSPGGDTPDNPSERREVDGGELYWNEVFTKPLSWKRGFRKCTKPLVEGIMGLPFEKSGKMYAFANLDWNAQSSDRRRMEGGLPDVLRVMRLAKSRLAALMREDVKEIVIPFLEKNVGLELSYERHEFPVKLSGKGRPYIDSWKVLSSPDPDLELQFLVLLPQHPSWILTEPDAKEVANGVRSAIERSPEG